MSPELIQIKTKPDYFGEPMRLPTVPKSANPFSGLEQVSGCFDRDATIAGIASNVVELQNEQLSVTCIHKPENEVFDRQAIQSALDSLIVPRVGESGYFYLLSTEGNELHLTSPELTRADIYQSIGGFHEHTHNKLEEYRAMVGELEQRHYSVACALINIREGGILLETGAGADYARARALNEYCRDNGARLICHDVAPAAAKAAGDKIEGIPYISVSPHSQFLGNVFLGVENQQIHIALKDVVSSVAHGMLRHLWSTASKAKAARVVLSQSVAISETPLIIPPRFWASSEHFINSCSASLPELLRKKNLSPNMDLQLAFYCAHVQASHTYRCLALDLALRSFLYAGDEVGYKYSQAYTSEASTTVSRDDAHAYVEEFFPNFLGSFEAGQFNTLNLGPLGVLRDKINGVSQGDLLIRNAQYHLVASQKRHEGMLKESSTPILSVKKQSAFKGPCGNQPLRFMNKKELVLRVAEATGQEISSRVLRRNNYESALEAGAEFATKYALDFLGQELKLPVFMDAQQARVEILNVYTNLSRN